MIFKIENYPLNFYQSPFPQIYFQSIRDHQPVQQNFNLTDTKKKSRTVCAVNATNEIKLSIFPLYLLAKIYAKKNIKKMRKRRIFFNGRTALEMLQTQKRREGEREELKVHCLHKNTAILDVQYDFACKQRVNRQNLHKNLNKKRERFGV